MRTHEMMTQPSKFDAPTPYSDNEAPMEITMALLADAANVSQEGKLNVLGAFTNIKAGAMPARHPEMQMVLEIDASAAEIGAEKDIEVKLLDEDGQELGGISGKIKVPRPPRRHGQRLRMGMVLRLNDVVFLRSGNHVFDILIDGDSKRRVPLSVTLIAEEGEAE